MALKIYTDNELAQEVLQPQRFFQSDAVNPGVFTEYALTKLTGAQVGSVYKVTGGLGTKLLPGADYTIADSQITLVQALVAGDTLIAVPTARFVLNFAGNENDVKTATRFINLARTENFAYSLIRVSSEDLTTVYSTTVETAGDFVFNAGVGTGFMSNFGVNSLINHALVLNNVYVGKVVSNTADSVTLDTTYTYGGGTGQIGRAHV